MENSKDHNAAAEPPLDCKVGLLPCPFCGSQPRMIEEFGRTLIYCAADECSVHPSVNSYFPRDRLGAGKTAEELWNKRAPNI
jgi:hypothetical protein